MRDTPADSAARGADQFISHTRCTSNRRPNGVSIALRVPWRASCLGRFEQINPTAGLFVCQQPNWAVHLVDPRAETHVGLQSGRALRDAFNWHVSWPQLPPEEPGRAVAEV